MSEQSPVAVNAPLTDTDVMSLKAGMKVLLTGFVYTARDAAHKKIFDLIQKNEKLPFELKGQVIYYTGPTPTRPGEVIGAAGPTTSYRMDRFAPALLEHGLKGMIGKGERCSDVVDAMKKHKGVYFVAVGGAAALLRKKIESCEIIAYPELGTEAVRKLFVRDFPLLVGQDCFGGNLYKEGVERYRR